MATTSRPESQTVDSQWVTLIFVAVMLGLVMSFSASYPEAYEHAGKAGVDALSFFRSQFGYALLGLIAGLVMSCIPLKWIRLSAVPLLLFFFVLMLVAIIQGMLDPDGGTRGAYNWVDLKIIPPFQPSEMAKLFYVAAVASLLSQGTLQGQSLRRYGQPLLVFVSLFCLLLVGQRDLGMLILIVGVTLVMCFLGGMRMRTLLLVIGVLVGMALLYALLDRGEHGGRFAAWLDPRAHRTDNGYQTLAMLVALARGGVLGQGVGESLDKWGQMPEAHTDAIFCVMGGEIGFARLAVFLVLLGWIIVRAIQIGRQASDGFGHFLALGVAVMIGVQALINMAVATNLMPVTGLTLPYISYGGSSLISCLMAAGLVLAVYRDRRSPSQGAN